MHFEVVWRQSRLGQRSHAQSNACKTGWLASDSATSILKHTSSCLRSSIGACAPNTSLAGILMSSTNSTMCLPTGGPYLQQGMPNVVIDVMPCSADGNIAMLPYCITRSARARSVLCAQVQETQCSHCGQGWCHAQGNVQFLSAWQSCWQHVGSLPVSVPAF